MGFEKRAGVIKPMESNGPKSKSKAQRPIRGLVFGPTRGAIEMSESGKRLRVERDSVGRAGGAFDNGGGKSPEEDTTLSQRGLVVSVSIGVEKSQMGEELNMHSVPPDGRMESVVA